MIQLAWALEDSMGPVPGRGQGQAAGAGPNGGRGG